MSIDYNSVAVERLDELLVLDRSTGDLTWRVDRKADIVAGSPALNYVNAHGYRVGVVDYVPLRANRVVFAMVHGRWPEEGMVVDHIDGDKTNNAPSNLAEVTYSQNSIKGAVRADNKSGHKGVSWDAERKKWRVKHKGKLMGRYATFAEAVAAKEAVREH